MTEKELAEIIIDYHRCSAQECEVCGIEQIRIARNYKLSCDGVVSTIAFELAKLILKE